MTDKPGLKTKTITSLDYIEAAEYIDKVLGFPQRDAHQHFKPELPHVDPEDNKYGQQDSGKFLDYWHYMIDEVLMDVRNDTYIPGEYSFEWIADDVEQTFGAENWRTIIAKTWAREYPGDYKIWMSW